MRRTDFKKSRGKQMEKVKTFAICLLLISILLSYSLILQLWMDKRNLQNKVNDLESALRVHKIIQETGRNGG